MIEGDFDIDFTYICQNRIAVMSFPASGIKAQWRNNYIEVKRYLDLKHPKKYWIFNCSEKTYDISRFENRVSNYNWQDHHAPPSHLLFSLVKEMHEWLKADPEHVVVMHCNSGKGRAGTACCCLLLFSGFYDNIVDSAKLFGARRFTDEKGVS